MSRTGTNPLTLFFTLHPIPCALRRDAQAQAEREKAEREAAAARGEGADSGAAKQRDSKGTGGDAQAGGREAAAPAALLAEEGAKRCASADCRVGACDAAEHQVAF